MKKTELRRNTLNAIGLRPVIVRDKKSLQVVAILDPLEHIVQEGVEVSDSEFMRGSQKIVFRRNFRLTNDSEAEVLVLAGMGKLD